MQAIGSWVASVGAALSAVLFAMVGLNSGMASMLILTMVSAFNAVPFVITFVNGNEFSGASVASTIFFVLAAVASGFGMFIANHNLKADWNKDDPSHNPVVRHPVSRVSIVWMVFAIVGTVFFIAAIAYNYVQLSQNSNINVSFVQLLVNMESLLLNLFCPFVSTAILVRQNHKSPPGVSLAQMRAFSLGGVVTCLGWMLYVVPSVWSPIFIVINYESYDITANILAALAAVCFCVASIGYDVSFRRIRKYIRTDENQLHHHHHHHSQETSGAPPYQPLNSPAQGYQYAYAPQPGAGIETKVEHQSYQAQPNVYGAPPAQYQNEFSK